ncbi:hypothetical protein SAMN05421833_102254 [Microbispora rosea]|uniref:Uncharacterized protein n=1 Tax=Microbispora rosea TaxID=58117 RepID=A0A1N6T8I4_9ACTN|nr:hypothetical protein [Microbispora rosea]GIH45170.1 hypothetical protein Mro03_03490 [Microbispora rosea subsp. rosea]SIQ49537.1 hypothetical protein SAMN05421833_102254 [Microbispora rosea]
MRDGRPRGRVIWAPVAAAALSGLVIGGLARLLMRGIALAVGGLTGMSLAGTVAILVAFVVLALPAAVTAAARPAIMHAGRWVTVALTGLVAARTGLGDAKIIVLADDDQLTPITMLIVAFAAIVVAHGRLAQHLTRRFRALPHAPAEALRTPDARPV